MTPERRLRRRIILAFAIVYLVWGSTYLGIRVALDTLPPFLLAGARFVVAGALLYAWARPRSAEAPTAREWWAALGVGILMATLGNGLVVWAELRISSGQAALLAASVPIFVTLLTAARGRLRPGPRTWLGVALGLVGQLILIGPGIRGGFNLAGVAAVLVAAAGWSIGMVISGDIPRPAFKPLGTAMQMIAGGAPMLLIGAATGEISGTDWSRVSLASGGAWLYLTIFGSLVAFTAYIWLLTVVAAPKVATTGYVNPVVAVWLGWLLLHEPLTPRMIAAGAIALVGVALVTLGDAPRAAPVAADRPYETAA